MNARSILSSVVLFLVAALAPPAGAAVKPHGLFTDGAVLQRGMRVPVWGTANSGERVTVTFQNQKATTTAVDGKWMVRLRPLKAGGPSTLTIQGENTVEIKNVLVGEVYVCSGQSNMEWSVTASANPQETIAQSADSQLRLISIQKATSETPLHDVTAQWKECGPSTVGSFTAVGYSFGKELRRVLKVPVGLIQSAWGGTVAEAWTSGPTLEANPTLYSLLTSYATAKRGYPFALMAHQQALENHRIAAEKARMEGRQAPQPPAAPRDPNAANNPNRPSVLYNAMISPLLPYGIRGAIWYQGESNAGRAHQYQTLFPAMIADWRQSWGQGDFPFLFVQLAPFMAIQNEPAESAWAELREAQRVTTLTVPNTGMAVITDLGDERDIHPRQKEPVGRRLAYAALAIANGEELVYSGPTYRSMKVDENRVILRFKYTGGGLVAKDGPLKGFTIAGADAKWFNAQAEIQGDRVIVSSPQVQHPTAVRFGWANYPVVNLYNKEGLPASPFRTDNFPLTTQPK